jgi:hypothetical protein
MEVIMDEMLKSIDACSAPKQPVLSYDFGYQLLYYELMAEDHEKSLIGFPFISSLELGRRLCAVDELSQGALPRYKKCDCSMTTLMRTGCQCGGR